MKRSYLLVLASIFALLSCEKDDQKCTTCTTSNQEEIAICELENGNAEVNGQDTGQEYDTYIDIIEDTGSCD